jgi:hypothetical protein
MIRLLILASVYFSQATTHPDAVGDLPRWVGAAQWRCWVQWIGRLGQTRMGGRGYVTGITPSPWGADYRGKVRSHAVPPPRSALLPLSKNSR